MLTECMPLLIDFLSVGDVFRLARALCMGREYNDAEVAACISRRMEYKKLTALTLVQLSERMWNRGRCWECGIKTSRLVRICEVCGVGDCLYAALRDRDYIYDCNEARRIPFKNLRNVIRTRLKRAARRSTGKHLFWKRDVDSLFHDA